MDVGEYIEARTCGGDWIVAEVLEDHGSRLWMRDADHGYQWWVAQEDIRPWDEDACSTDE